MNGQVGLGESEWVEPGSAGEEVFYVEGQHGNGKCICHRHTGLVGGTTRISGMDP